MYRYRLKVYSLHVADWYDETGEYMFIPRALLNTGWLHLKSIEKHHEVLSQHCNGTVDLLLSQVRHDSSHIDIKLSSCFYNTFKNKLQWNFNRNTKLFVHKNAAEIIPSFLGIGIPILKIRRSWDRRIFIIGISMLITQRLYIPGTKFTNAG